MYIIPKNKPMPEIDICRSCDRCADFTPIAESFIERTRVLSMAQRNPDDVFAARLDIAAREARNRKLRKRVRVLGHFAPKRKDPAY